VAQTLSVKQYYQPYLS